MPLHVHLSIEVRVDAYSKFDLAELSSFNLGRKVLSLLGYGTLNQKSFHRSS